MSPALTRERYLGLLQSFYGFYLPLERNLVQRAEWSLAGLTFERRIKLPWLLADLAELGLSKEAIDHLPICPVSALPAVERFEEALGCLYVLEGATLGGQVISRHLQRTLGLGKGSGGAFFSSYGPEVGPMWTEFVAALNGYPQTPLQHDLIVSSACNTFQAFDQWFLSRERQQ